jgi:hypothetical protein
MELNSSSGMDFKLEIEGYQFPDLETEIWDSNWLIIQINVSHPNGNWSATDACLLTYEIASLANWFEQISNGKNDKLELGFLEPALHFKLIESNGVANRALYVFFDMVLRPSWAKSLNYRDVWVKFPLAEINLMKASMQLREQLSQFPQRAER